MEGIQQWILSVTALSVLAAVCQAAMPPGTVKRVSGMTCALLLFIVIVRPAIGADYERLIGRFTGSYAALGKYDTTLQETNLTLTRDLIASGTAAYIEDKAAASGLMCQAEVSCREEDGLPIPAAVTFSGTFSAAQRQRLTALAETELDVTDVRFEEGEGGA